VFFDLELNCFQLRILSKIPLVFRRQWARSHGLKEKLTGVISHRGGDGYGRRAGGLRSGHEQKRAIFGKQGSAEYLNEN